jgi:hypothetical protein
VPPEGLRLISVRGIPSRNRQACGAPWHLMRAHLTLVPRRVKRLAAGSNRWCGSTSAERAPTLEENMKRLLFLVHPDMFSEGGQAQATNEQSVKAINSFVDEHSQLDDPGWLPPPRPAQPIPLKLFVRTRGTASATSSETDRPITAVLHAASHSQPLAFQQSMDRLFGLVGLASVWRGEQEATPQFRQGSIGWLAQLEGAALRVVLQRVKKVPRSSLS